MQVGYAKEKEKRALFSNMAEPITWVRGGAETQITWLGGGVVTGAWP